MYMHVCADRLIDRYVSLNSPTTLTKTDLSYSEKLGASLLLETFSLACLYIRERDRERERSCDRVGVTHPL